MTDKPQTDKPNSELAQQFAKATDNVKELAEELKGKMANGEKLTQTAKDAADEALLKYGELKSRMDELEQKQARPAGGDTHQKSIGEQFVETDSYKSFVDNPRATGKASLEVKSTITSDTAGSLVPTHRLGGIIAPPNSRLTVRDLLMAGTTSSNSIEYVRETGFTNNATAQSAEGARKAESSLEFDDQTTPVRTLAHFIKASRQILDDAPQLASYINGRLAYGLAMNEERQLLNGDGQNGNIKGIIPQATAFIDKASLAEYTKIDQLRLAALQVALAEYPANGFVLNPIDWATIELTKDDNGRYIIGNPQGVLTPTLWNIPVVTTQSMGMGQFLTGAFNLAAQIFDRQATSIQVGFENDDFTSNKITILAEERLALAVYRPEAFVYGTLADKN